jgi:hypothetical protein
MINLPVDASLREPFRNEMITLGAEKWEGSFFVHARRKKMECRNGTPLPYLL